MKIVVDTNVYISALVFNKKVQQILEILLEEHTVYISAFIIEEFTEKLIAKFKFEEVEVESLLKALMPLIKLVEPQGELPTDSKDPDDNNILLLAEYVNADLIVSGNKDLYELNHFKNIPILKPAEIFSL